MTMEIEIKGRDLIKRLSRLEDKVEKRIGKMAIRAGGSEYAKLLRRELPVSDDGNDVTLKKSIAIQGTKGKEGNQLRVQVGVKGRARHYAHLVEFGGRDGNYRAANIFTQVLESSTAQIFNRIGKKIQMELEKIGG